MFSFSYYTPTKVVFGPAAEEQTGGLVKAQGCKKALIHYGGGSVVRSGLLDRIKASMDQAGVAYVELGGVVPNPRLSLVYQGIDLVRQSGVDFILAVGGGSVIDSAKAIAYGAVDEGDVWDLYDHTRQAAGCLPVGAVLTIAAAGSETASGCTDILMHTMERYFTPEGNMEITDSIAEGLLRTVMRNAQILRDDPKNCEARAEVMWAGSLSHNGLTGNQPGDWATHGLEHEMGGMFDVTHGAGLAAVWGSWARYVYRDCLHRFVRFAVNVMGVPEAGAPEETALKGIEAMEDFFRSIEMPVCFSQLGIAPTQEQMETMARMCAVAAGGKKGTARVLCEADFLKIYQMAYH